MLRVSTTKILDSSYEVERFAYSYNIENETKIEITSNRGIHVFEMTKGRLARNLV